MKRYQAILLALFLAASMSLTACGGNAASGSDTSGSGVSSEVSSEGSAEDSSSEEASSEESAESDTHESLLSAESLSSSSSSSSSSSVSSSSSSSSASSRPSSSSSSSSSSKPSSSSSSSSSSKPSSSSSSSQSSSSKEESSSDVSSEVQAASCADIYSAAIAGIQLPAQMTLDDETIGTCYTELDVNDLADYYVSTPMMIVHATEIAVFRPEDKAAAKSVKAAIDSRVNDLMNIWGQYLPAQYELVEDHQIVEKNGYILFVVAEEADKIVDQFVKAVK